MTISVWQRRLAVAIVTAVMTLSLTAVAQPVGDPGSGSGKAPHRQSKLYIVQIASEASALVFHRIMLDSRFRKESRNVGHHLTRRAVAQHRAAVPGSTVWEGTRCFFHAVDLQTERYSAAVGASIIYCLRLGGSPGVVGILARRQGH